ncbi:alpha/beta hydrolase [Spirillospora sp. NPDC047279]|uniref:alpha/beta fold hydrolase n=1 Tax=Spirillospora sp. NPDC047279 TaxID=3155478 RepID=UPI00340E3BC8
MTEYLDVDGGRIAYDVTGGDGPLVVLAPGMGVVRGTFRLLAPKLAEAGYRVAALDLRGHGESSVPFASYSITDSGKDLAALIRHLGGGPAVVLGNSFSSGSAAWVAAHEPALVRAIVLEAPFARTVKMNPVMRQLARVILSVPTLWGIYYKNLLKGPKPDDFPAYLKALKANMGERGRLAAARTMGLDDKPEMEGVLTRVAQPALVVMGTRDPDFPDPRAEAEIVAGELAGKTEIVMIEGSGHYPHQEFPAETAATVLTFLNEVA